MAVSQNFSDFYKGTQQEQDVWKLVRASGEMPWYVALEISFIVIAMSAMIIFLAAWLKGSPWINKSNPYVKGQVYVRDWKQNIVFRMIMVFFGFYFISAFFIESVWDIRGMIPNNPVTGNNMYPNVNEFSQTFAKYTLSPIIWYYQCFITSTLLGFAIFFKKYKVALWVWPLGVVGGISTLATTDGILARGHSFEGFEFHRSLIEHLMIILLPIFIISAQRYSYTLKNTTHALSYAFFTTMVVYLLFTFTSILNIDGSILSANSSGKLVVEGVGEISQISSVLGFSEAWLVANFHIFVWLILIPMGFVSIIILTMLRQLFYHFGNTTYTSDKKKKNTKSFFDLIKWKFKTFWSNWFKNDIKLEWKELISTGFINFFTRVTKSPKVKYTDFGEKCVDKTVAYDANIYLSFYKNNLKTHRRSINEKNKIK